MVSIHLLNAGGKLTRLAEHVHSIIESEVSDIEKHLTLPKIDIVVDSDKARSIPETGIGGFASHAHRLDVYLDVDHPELGKHLERNLRSTIAHELHHCARWATCGYGMTLAEAVVSEGLADHFDLEMHGPNPPPWSTALDEEALAHFGDLLPKIGWSTPYDHNAWFFGSDIKNLPRWTGYSLGYAIVKEYLLRNGKKASELIGEPASSFIDKVQD